MKIWKFIAGVLLILAGTWGMLEILGRLLFNLWMNHEIEVLSERMRQDENKS